MGGSASKPSTDLPEINEDTQKRSDALKDTRFTFTNLVFGGGGAKGTAYIGALQILDDLGLLQNMRRFGGTSSGAIIACALALGYSVKDIHKISLQMRDELIFDSWWWGIYFTFYQKLTEMFGINTGKNLKSYIENIVATKKTRADYTFRELYEDDKIELCVIAANLTSGSAEYFHPKTTPDIPIAEAVATSASIPIILQPHKFFLHDDRGNTPAHVLVDGGLVDNFSLHCYDGWYLSMKDEDNFLRNMEDIENRFSGRNDNTLGMMIWSHKENIFLENEFLKRYGYQNRVSEGEGCIVSSRPNTTLTKERPACEEHLKRKLSTFQTCEAGLVLAREMRSWNPNQTITVQRFTSELGRESSDQEKVQAATETLFGQGVSIEDAYKILDKNTDGKVTFLEIADYLKRSKDVSIRHFMEGGTGTVIKTLSEFLSSMLETLETHMMRMTLKRADLSRVVGIYTDYVTTLDCDLEDEDRKFLYMQGQLACLAFLEEIKQRREEAESHQN